MYVSLIIEVRFTKNDWSENNSPATTTTLSVRCCYTKTENIIYLNTPHICKFAAMKCIILFLRLNM